MYHAACKVEWQPFNRSYAHLTFFNFYKIKCKTLFFIYLYTIFGSFGFFFFFLNEHMSRIKGKNPVSFWVSPPNPEPEEFLRLSVWKLEFRFKTRMNRAQDVMYQCSSVESTLM